MANPSVGTSVFPSYSNGIVPQATGYATSYIRKASDFKVNKYTQLIEAPGTTGLYYVIDRDTPARIVNDAEWALWVDGGERPVTNENNLQYAMANFTTTRRNYATMLGNQAIDMNSRGWKIKEHHVGALAQQEVTNRTNRVVSMIEAASNWNANTADANALNGGAGTWANASDDQSSANYNAILKSLQEAMRRIVLATRGRVQRKDMLLLISPGLAMAMGNSAEIHSYLRHGPYSYPRLDDDDKEFTDYWGVPPMLYGLEVVIEDCVRVTDRPTPGGGVLGTASANAVFVKSDTSAAIVSRVGGLDGLYGTPSFSTVQLFWYEYMAAVYSFADARNQRLELHLTSQFEEILVAPESGFLITNTI